MQMLTPLHPSSHTPAHFEQQNCNCKNTGLLLVHLLIQAPLKKKKKRHTIRALEPAALLALAHRLKLQTNRHIVCNHTALTLKMQKKKKKTSFIGMHPICNFFAKPSFFFRNRAHCFKHQSEWQNLSPLNNSPDTLDHNPAL